MEIDYRNSLEQKDIWHQNYIAHTIGTMEEMKKKRAVRWYTQGRYESVIFVPSTPRSVLQRQYQEEINRHDIKIRVVEKAGRSVKSMLQRSDPFKPRTCGRALCFICETEKKGSCDGELRYNLNGLRKFGRERRVSLRNI